MQEKWNIEDRGSLCKFSIHLPGLRFLSCQMNHAASLRSCTNAFMVRKCKNSGLAWGKDTQADQNRWSAEHPVSFGCSTPGRLCSVLCWIRPEIMCWKPHSKVISRRELKCGSTWFKQNHWSGWMATLYSCKMICTIYFSALVKCWIVSWCDDWGGGDGNVTKPRCKEKERLVNL